MENNFEEWEKKFEEGWKVRVIENDHLKDLCFLQYLSTINKVRYIYAGQYKTINLSSLKIQQSGTGKGVADGYVHDLLNYLGYKVAKVNIFTEAAMIGTLNTDPKGNTEVIKGAFGEYDFIWIDEARNLINGSKHTQGLLEVVNGYLDDGKIYKRLAKGEIKYSSKCNFGTGTFFFDSLKPAVLTTGLFQRTLLSYKSFSQEDIMRISKHYDSLANKDYKKDMLPVFNSFKEMKKELDFNKYKKISNGPNGETYTKYVINIDIEASEKFGALIDDYFLNHVINHVNDDSLKSILSSFLIRLKELGHKIMSLYSVWNGYETVNVDSVDFAYNFVKTQMMMLLDLIGDGFEGKCFNTAQFNNESITNRKHVKTRQGIIKIIQQKPNITKTELYAYILNHRIQGGVGINQIMKWLLPEMIEEKVIGEKICAHNRTELFTIDNSQEKS